MPEQSPQDRSEFDATPDRPTGEALPGDGSHGRADEQTAPTSESKTPKPARRKPRARSINKDIAPVLRDWRYEPGEINVRKISGLDGSPKLQMRLNLGVLQMELIGRPDGHRPHGHESLLEYFEEQRRDHEKQNQGGQGNTGSGKTGSGKAGSGNAGQGKGGDTFFLTGEQCRSLREEAEMYYHRYISLLVLEDFAAVARDTARNLRVLDLCSQFAREEQDRLFLEQYRPYIIMMNARARASMEIQDKHFGEALKIVDTGIRNIREFYERFGQEEAFNQSSEVRLLKRLSKQIQSKLPVDPVQQLRRRLDRAVKEERYEVAAKLRDQLQALTGPSAAAADDPTAGMA